MNPGQPMNIVKIPVVPGTDIYVPKELGAATLAQLRGKVCGFSLDEKNPISPIEGEPPIHRILDIGAGCGAFAAYAAFRWPYAWIDCFESNPVFESMLKANMPPGGRIVSREELLDLPCDLLHIGDPSVVALQDLPMWAAKIIIAESVSSDGFVEMANYCFAHGLELVGGSVFEQGVAWQAWMLTKKSIDEIRAASPLASGEA